MTNDRYDVRWSPFDPDWFRNQFDKPVNVADTATMENELIGQGYELPDADGSISSAFRNEAVLNNSFDEDILRESLRDIYTNTSHRLVASNHDNTHFFKWVGSMKDMKIISNTNYCQFVIPTDQFIYPNERDSYKLSQMYRRWIKVEDVLNNWDIFKWHCMLFIDQKVYSEYELRIDDQEVTIRFRYYDFWVSQNFPVYIYKFDTNASARILVSQELCVSQWNWKMPVNYIKDLRICNSSNVIVTFNKISDKSIRADGEEHVEVLGDNMEFLQIKGGYIDLSEISDFNKAYILSEKKEWLWMSIFVPKFFHEYPIILPTDVIYQPYEANLQPVVTVNYDMVQPVKGKLSYSDETYSQVYVDLNGELQNHHDYWKQLIRPVVLSDAFDSNYVEPYDHLIGAVDKLKELTIAGADLIEEFRFYVKNYDSVETFKDYCSRLRKSMDEIRNCMHEFLDNIYAEYDLDYEALYKRFLGLMEEIDEEGVNHELFHTVTIYERPDRDFWMIISPLIWIPRGLADKYHVINIIHDMGDNVNVWEDRDAYKDKIRFQRPVDESDFWTFEYDVDKQVWRPYPLDISRHFPDVYVMKDPKEEVATPNRVFKTFFFYSDTMNVTNEASDMVRPTASWDDDVEEYHIDRSAVYRDIFMEKFYWVGMRSIYKGILVTKNRWEVIEYVIDNESYERFNQLFLNTMDPYYKLGLATYLRSPDYGFPFDSAIHKMEESINSEFIGYRRVTNFEVYLNKSWIPSYFDFVTKVMNDWEYADRLIKRPRSTFDIYRLLPTMLSAQNEIYDASRKLMDLIHYIIEKLNEEDYKLNVTGIEQLGELIDSMHSSIESAYNDTKNLDIQIFSINDINCIIEKLTSYPDHQQLISDKFDEVRDDVEANNIHDNKRHILDSANEHIKTVNKHIDLISGMINEFSITEFMNAVNDLQTYFDHNKDNPNDNSLLGHINKFDDMWTSWVKAKRNKLFISTNKLIGFYDASKLYEEDDINTLINLIDDSRECLQDIKTTIDEFYAGFEYERDEVLSDKFDRSEYLLESITVHLEEMLDARSLLVDVYNAVVEILNSLEDMPNDTEFGFVDNIKSELYNVIRHLSYIAGQGHKDDAEQSLSIVVQTVQKWYKYLNTEKEIFDHLEVLVDPPIEIINILDKYRDTIQSMIDYMDTVNIEYVPDSEWPTYSDIYRVTKVDIASVGFMHDVDDFIFAPKLGTYQVDEIDGVNNNVKIIRDTKYRNTTFRNPMMQYRPYDTITSGNGMGIFLTPLEVEHKVIINDTVVDNIVKRLESLLRTTSKNVKTYNPTSNNDMSYIIKDIKCIHADWVRLIDKFWDHMTPAVKLYVNDLVELLVSAITYCEQIIKSRDRISITEFIKLYQDYIYGSYNYTRDSGTQDETFFYYDAIIRTSYEEIVTFYGTGTTWTDGQQLKRLLAEASRIIKFYWDKVFGSVELTDRLSGILDTKESLLTMIDSSIESICQIPTQVLDINGLVGRITDKLSVLPERKKDLWYRFRDASVAIEGMEYKVGDIVELIPSEDDEANMVPLTVSDIHNLWYPGIDPDNYDKDAYNPTGVRQINEPEVDTMWDGGIVSDDNPGNQRIKLVSMKRSEIIKLWNGEYVSEDAEDVAIDEGSDEVILLQVTAIDEFGRVRSVKPFMDYAIPYELKGVRKTRSRVGKGYGLQINCNSTELTLNDSTLLVDDESVTATHPKFDENDLMVFRFENIHDLNVTYEVFLGGKQLQDFVIRHDDLDDPLHPGKIDMVYMNANQVIDLQNSSIYIPAEQYFTYKIDDISVLDPGAGYCKDQTIFVDVDNHVLRMKVAELTGGPHKGIATAVLSDGSLLYEKDDPSKPAAEVVTDSINNIDDEFNVGYYDMITKEGIVKPLTKSLDGYTFTAKRFDDLPVDNRNASFMYPNATMQQGYPHNGDPDYHWYQGSRIGNSLIDGECVEMVQMTVLELSRLWKFSLDPDDYDKDAYNPTGVRQINEPEVDTMWDGGIVSDDNPGNQRIGLTKITDAEITRMWNGESIYDDNTPPDGASYTYEDAAVWNGILNTIPPTDPFIPDIQRTPVGQPAKGEYQLIQSLRIHNTNGIGEFIEMTQMTVDEITNLWKFSLDPDNYDKDAYNPTGVRQINEPEVDTMWDGGIVSDDNPGNQRIKLKIISPLEVFMLWNGNNIDESDDDSDEEHGEIITDVTSVFDFRVDSLENSCMVEGDLVVEHFSDLPRHKEDYPDGCVGKKIIVEHDETNYGHRMLYRIRTFVAAGFFVYDLPEVADYAWNEFNVNWMESDWIADFPTAMAQYPEAPWETSPSYRKVMHRIMDEKIDSVYVPSIVNNSSFISNLTVDDLSVYNWSTHEWEDLHDADRWELTTRHNDDTHEWGFTLRFIQDGNYAYDMRLYLNKTPYTQQKNAELKKNAVINVSTVIHSEVNHPAINMSVLTGRHIRIRKLFPYVQKESYVIGFDSDGGSLGYKMDFKLAPYMHFKNQLHLEDIQIYNKSVGRFEDILDTRLFEVQFKDSKAVSRGYEWNTKITQVIIGSAGKGFIDGFAWAWNLVYKIIVFGMITTSYDTDGHIVSFTPFHCPNPSRENISLEFEVFQNNDQSDSQKGVVVICFETTKSEVYGDGYIHNVTNRLAPLPDEFRVVVQYDLIGSGEYDIIIDNTPKIWTFIEPHWTMLPTFHIDDCHVAADKLYVMTDKGRLPLINPSTKRPTLTISHTYSGTDVTYMNLYKGFSRLSLHSVPYPMRSVYVQRNIPKDGYVDLAGKINKPLNKKYFEFWVNGRLLCDEVTIITPTRIFLHGLTSLKNLEIIEINRDPNEFFSDSFLEVEDTSSRPYVGWNYTTYLDDALDGNLEKDNYSLEEQASLLSPVWPQVDETSPDYMNYPPNVDTEQDILSINIDDDIDEVENPLYQYIVLDPPTLEGKQLFDQGLSFKHFGLLPISDEMIVNMLNDEWQEEIKNDPNLHEHFVISDDEWYGSAARLYDEFGIQVHTLNEAAYNIHTDEILRINTKTKSNNVMKQPVTYDFV